MKLLIKYWRANQPLLLAWISGFILVLQVMNLHSYVVQTVDHQAMVSVNDDDAAWNVAKTIKTRWWKDNGWALYGPGYFRLNHSVHYLWGRTADPRNEGANENWERTAHHAVMTTALLSVVGIALLIACHLLVPWWQRFLFAFGFIGAFTSVPAYSEFILRAHPDMLFAFLTVAALAFTIRMFIQPQEKLWFLLSACLWGFSIAAKLTTALCAPGFLLLFVPPFNRNNFKRGLKYLGVMLLAYFIIGFPQTIVLNRPVKMILEIGGLSTPVTWASVNSWIKLFAQQGLPFFGLMWLACIDFTTRKWTLPKGARWRIWAFVALPFLILLTKNMMVPAAHYTVAFISMLCLAMAMFWRPPLAQYFTRKDEYPILRGILFFALVLAAFGSTPKVMQAELNKRVECRPEARDLYSRVKDLYIQGRNIWVDPYIPTITDAPNSRVEVSWEKTWSGYARGNWTVLALSREFMGKYIGADIDDYTKTDTKGWAGMREFYLAFANGDEAKTPEGHIFKRVYQNSCKQELWLRQ